MMYGTGWIPDAPEKDSKDWTIPSLPRPSGTVVTRNRDVFSPPARNQKRSNECTNFSLALAMQHAHQRQEGRSFPFSAQFNAWCSRTQEERETNTGVMIRTACDAVRRYGICSEDQHPFEASGADYLTRLATTPPDDAFSEARNHQSLKHYRVADGDIGGIEAAMAAGYGVIIGIPLYANFHNPPSTGVIPLPAGGITGYHAMYALDVDVIGGEQVYLTLNHWSPQWGALGRCWLRRRHLEEARDLWVITLGEVVRAK